MSNISNENEFEKKVEEELAKIVRDNPTRIMMFMMVEMGKIVIETNAGEAVIKQGAIFGDQRYEIKAKITVKKLKS